MQKDRNGKIKMEPDLGLEPELRQRGLPRWLHTTGWYYILLGDNEHIWLRRLISGTPDPTGTTGDPDFNQRIADRWSELRTNVFATSNVLTRVNELTNLLSEAANRDFQKWPRLGTYIWPNPKLLCNTHHLRRDYRGDEELDSGTLQLDRRAVSSRSDLKPSGRSCATRFQPRNEWTGHRVLYQERVRPPSARRRQLRQMHCNIRDRFP
jgi:hypothetical protein